MSRGPTQRNQKGVCVRKDGKLHGGSERSQFLLRDTPIYYRGTNEEFEFLQRLLIEHRYRSRADLFADALELFAIVAKAAAEVGHADKVEFIVRAIEAKGCFEKRVPIPAWAQLEVAPALLPPPVAESSNP